MTLIVGNVVDVGLRGLDGALRVWAWFRPEEVGLIAPYRREWEIRQGEIEPGVDVVPGPAVVEVDCGPDAYTSVEVTVPDAESVSLKDLFEQVYTYTPQVVSEAYAERLRAEVAAVAAEESAGVALGAERGALAAESGAALHAATLSARIEQPGQDILYTSDGKPYFADPAQIENVPLTVDTSAGTRVFLGDAMIHGDTGWRNIGANGTASWDFSGHGRYGIAIRRQGSRVSIWVAGHFDQSTGRILFTAPPGFVQTSPLASRAYATVGTVKIGSTLYEISALGNGLDYYITGGAGIATGSIIQEFTWQTGDPWPTSLPGTPAN